MHRKDRPLPVLVLAGAGGNGRAGLRAGIELLQRGYRVEVKLIPAPQEGDRYDGYPVHCDEPRALWLQDASSVAHQLLDAFLACGGLHTPRSENDDVRAPCIAIDAICGRGFEGRLRGPAAQWAGKFWRGTEVVAVDCPTGMNPDTGRTMELTDAAPALGGFTASATVIAGGLRPVHLLREDCGRLVFVKTGVGRFLWRIDNDNRTNCEYLDFFDEYGYLPVRERRAFLAQDPCPDDTFPVFTAYSDDGEGELINTHEGCVQVLGSLSGDHHDRKFGEGTRSYPPKVPEMATVGIAGVPDRRPGAPALVASGAVQSAACNIVVDAVAASRVSWNLPGVEVASSNGGSPRAEIPWVLCSGETDGELIDSQMIVVTRDAVRDWIDSGTTPPAEPEDARGKHVVLVVDRQTAEEALAAWGDSPDEELEVVDAITLAEELSACVRTSVILSGSTIVYVRKLDTWILRSGSTLNAQGAEEVLAGAVAVGMVLPDSTMNLYIPLLLCARGLTAVSRAEPAVAMTAGNLSETFPAVLRELRASADRLG